MLLLFLSLLEVRVRRSLTLGCSLVDCNLMQRGLFKHGRTNPPPHILFKPYLVDFDRMAKCFDEVCSSCTSGTALARGKARTQEGESPAPCARSRGIKEELELILVF